VLEADLDKLDQRTVLLLDDLVVTGWTLTLAASAIREAGATRVLPVALAVES
jgi:ATP-dependent DNA helicase RecQ